MPDSNSIKFILKNASDKLSNISDSPILDAELLLAHCIGKNRTFLHTWPNTELTNTQLQNFEAFIEKRLIDYPVAYLLGKKEFWTLELAVSPDVLIPRPETELLVEIALDKIKNIKEPNIIDLGTGSGAIALALASERSDASVIATDYSEKALNIATTNATNLKLENQVAFIQSNWFESVDKEKAFFDLIVSNPPYIDPKNPHLKETIRHEPQQALVADNCGMSDIEKIIQKSHLFLKKGGYIILEHGFDQAEKVAELMETYHYQRIKSYPDLNKILRLTTGIKS